MLTVHSYAPGRNQQTLVWLTGCSPGCGGEERRGPEAAAVHSCREALMSCVMGGRGPVGTRAGEESWRGDGRRAETGSPFWIRVLSEEDTGGATCCRERERGRKKERKTG